MSGSPSASASGFLSVSEARVAEWIEMARMLEDKSYERLNDILFSFSWKSEGTTSLCTALMEVVDSIRDRRYSDPIRAEALAALIALLSSDKFRKSYDSCGFVRNLMERLAIFAREPSNDEVWKARAEWDEGKKTKDEYEAIKKARDDAIKKTRDESKADDAFVVALDVARDFPDLRRVHFGAITPEKTINLWLQSIESMLPKIDDVNAWCVYRSNIKTLWKHLAYKPGHSLDALYYACKVARQAALCANHGERRDNLSNALKMLEDCRKRLLMGVPRPRH